MCLCSHMNNVIQFTKLNQDATQSIFALSSQLDSVLDAQRSANYVFLIGRTAESDRLAIWPVSENLASQYPLQSIMLDEDIAAEGGSITVAGSQVFVTYVLPQVESAGEQTITTQAVYSDKYEIDL